MLSQTVLIADDDTRVLGTLGEVVRDTGHRPILATRGKEAVEVVRRQPRGVSLSLLDVGLPDMSGFDAFRLIHEVNALIQVIFVTAEATPENRARASGLGAYRLLPKPLDLAEVRRSVSEVLTHIDAAWEEFRARHGDAGFDALSGRPWPESDIDR
ncbi:MAG: response regulator [Planctomycetes bacterium]|nr:response regulator [Planctomycetota bacterium]